MGANTWLKLLKLVSKISIYQHVAKNSVIMYFHKSKSKWKQKQNHCKLGEKEVWWHTCLESEHCPAVPSSSQVYVSWVHSLGHILTKKARASVCFWAGLARTFLFVKFWSFYQKLALFHWVPQQSSCFKEIESWDIKLFERIYLNSL
jgi:hypothetical protein